MLNKNGRFINGGTVQFAGDFLGWWERRVIPQQIDDQFIELDAVYEKRPDLIARAFLSDERMMWLVLQYNNVIDVETELLAGTVIRLPHPKRIVELATSG